MNFKGEVVVITGAGSGIGETSAKRFASEGAHVVIADIHEEAAARVALQIRQAGGEACELRTDVSNVADIRKLIAFAVNTYGKIDVLFQQRRHPNAEKPGRRYGGRMGSIVRRQLEGCDLLHEIRNA